MTNDRPTMSTREAAAYLGVSRPTLLRLWSQGLLEGYRVTPYQNGRVRLYRDSVDCLVETMWSGRRDSNPRPAPWQGAALPTEPLPQRRRL